MSVQSLCCFLFSLLCPFANAVIPPPPIAFLQRAADGETEARSREGKWLSQAWTPRGVPGSKSRVAPTTSTGILQHLFTLQRPGDTQLLPKHLGLGAGSRMGRSVAVSRAGCWEVQAARSQQALAMRDDWWCRTSPGIRGHHTKVLTPSSFPPALGSHPSSATCTRDMERGRNGPDSGQIGAGWGQEKMASSCTRKV